MTRLKQPIRCLAWRLRSNVLSLRWENVEWLSRVCHGSHEPLHSLYFRKNWKVVPVKVAKERLKLHWISFYFQTRSPYKYAYEERQSITIFRLGSSIIELYHAQICMQNIDHTHIKMDTISAISRTLTFGSFKTISWILFIISAVVISVGRPGLGVVLVLTRPQRNLVNHFWTIPYDGAESE